MVGWREHCDFNTITPLRSFTPVLQSLAVQFHIAWRDAIRDNMLMITPDANKKSLEATLLGGDLWRARTLRGK